MNGQDTQQHTAEDKVYLQQAIDLAAQNARSGQGGPFGAVVTRGGQVIATGVNLVTSAQDPTAHAEISAIRAACKALGSHDLHGCTLYSSCEPCPMCLTAILWSRADRLVFAATQEDAAAAGFDDRAFYEQVRLPAGQRTLPTSNCLRDQGKKPFAEWQAYTERQSY